MRLIQTLNAAWRFRKEDAAMDAAATDFADSDWRTVDLPHDWSIEEPRSQEWASAAGFLPGGIGWYRKRFEVPAAHSGKRVFVHFDGVYCNSDVWINGHHLGTRPNGFIPFRYDLTPYLRFGEENVLAVRVDHSKFADSRWYTGSGIYRKVSLLTVDPVHIGQWGVFVTTPSVTPEAATVRVEVTVQNETPSAPDVEVVTTLHVPDGTVVAEASTPLSVPAEGESIAETLMNVTSPLLWSPEEPNLYRLQIQVRRDGEVIDNEDTSVGIRSFRFDPEQGFFLNERPLKMKGVCLHDDAGTLGTAVLSPVWERRLRTLKEAGVNAIRMAHNPHMPELYDLCDRLGFLVQDEAFDEWELGKNKWIAGWNVGAPGKDGYHDHFSDWAEADLRDMILCDRNHPSIVMWSIGNEIDYPNDPYTHEVLDSGTNPQIYGKGFQSQNPHSNRLGEIAKQLVGIAKRYDSTRPVTAAISAAMISNETGFADALDVVGYNYQEYRYPEDHARYPNRALYGSENGMRFDFWQAVADNPYISAQFLWTGIDYLGEAGRWPSRGSGAGLLDLAGHPKTEFYYRQSIWSSEPMLYLGTSDVPKEAEAAGLWSHKKASSIWAGTPGELLRIVCFTNCEQVELFCNGHSLGRKSRTDSPDSVLFWDAPYEPGTLSASAWNGGALACSATLKTPGQATRIQASASGSVDLTHIEVTIVDEDGNIVPTATNEIRWEIEGPGCLLGIESGDLSSLEDNGSHTRRAYQGRLLGYVQVTEGSGNIRLRLTAPGLMEAVIDL